jgi:vitamin B12 transporter
MRFSTVSKAAIAAALALGATGVARAQDEETPPDTSPNAIDQVSRSDIVVTGGSREQLRSILSPGAVSVVYPDDTKGEHKSLPDLLDQVPGVYVRRVGGTGGYTTTSIRGSAPSQVNIYVDGVPYNTSSEVAVDISTIPIGNVERIEVYRGTVPARFSGSPLGGAINIVTKRAKGLSGTVSGGARSFGGYQVSANMNVPLFGGSLLVGADAEHSEGDFKYRNYGFEQVRNLTSGLGPDGKPNTFYDQYSFLYESLGLPGRNPRVEAFYPIERTRQNNSFDRYNGLARWTNDHFSVKYAFTYLGRYMPAAAEYSTTDVPTYTYPLPANVPGDLYGQYRPSVANPRKRQRQSQHDVALGWHDKFGRLEVAASLNAMDQRKNYWNLDMTGLSSLGALWSDFRTRRYGGQLDLAMTLADAGPITQRLELHAQGSRETMYADANGAEQVLPPSQQFHPTYYRRYRRHLVNFQAQDTITVHPLGDLQITPVARIERLSGPILGPLANPFGPSSGNYDWLPTYGVSGKKEFGKLLLFADVGTYNRYPNFYEIYGDGLNVQAGSSFLSDLRPLRREHGINSDIGIGWNGTLFGNVRASGRVTGFTRKTKDTISYYATPAGSKYINTGTTLTRGVELEGNLVLGKLADLQAAYTYQNGKYVKGTYYWFGGVSGSNALNIVGDPLYTLNNPRVVANARLNLHFLGGALTTFGEVRHTGRRYTFQGANYQDGGIAFNYDNPLTTLDLGAHYKFDNGIAVSLGVNDVFNEGPKQRYHLTNDIAQRQWSGCGATPASCQIFYYKAVDQNVSFPQQGRTFYFTLAKSFGPDHARPSRSRDGAAPAKSWSGFYIGGAIGNSRAPALAGEGLVFDNPIDNRPIDGVFNDYVLGVYTCDPTGNFCNGNAFQYGYDGSGAALGTVRADGVRPDRNKRLNYGFRAGYDRQIGSWLVGALAEWSRYGLTDAVSGYAKVYDADFNEVPAAYVFSRKLNATVSLRARGGFTLGPALVYGTAGVARGDVDHGFHTQNRYNSFAARGAEKHLWGPQLGGGVEARVYGPFTLGLEFLHTSLADSGYTVRATGGATPDLIGLGFQLCPGTTAACAGTDIKRSSDRYTIDTLRVTAGIRF